MYEALTTEVQRWLRLHPREVWPEVLRQMRRLVSFGRRYGGCRGASTRGWRVARVLTHPPVLAAFAALAVNDHVLKVRYPGTVTGKLSDFAGLFGVTAVVVAALRRPAVAMTLAGLSFSAIKLSAVAGGVAAPLLGGSTAQDVTDLLALAVIPVAGRSAQRALGRSQAASAGFPALGLLAVVLATTATSCVVPPQVDGFIAQPDGRVFAHVEDAAYDEGGNEVDASRWAVSTDGGRTFTAVTAPPEREVARQRRACGTACYRLTNDGVHRRAGSGTWRRDFRFSGEELERIRLRSDQDCGWSSEQFLAIAVLARADGEHVVVAMGTQGILHRSPQGAWSRRAVLDRTPIPLTGASWLSDLVLAPLLLPAVGLVLLVAAWRVGRAGQGLALLGVWTGLGVLVLSAGGFVSFFGVDYTIYGPAVVAVTVATAVIGGVASWRAVVESRRRAMPADK